MFKNKNLAKIITHKYTLYFMYFLALLIYSLILSNFVLGCGKISEGMEKDCGNCRGVDGWDAEDLTNPSQFTECVAKVQQCQKGQMHRRQANLNPMLGPTINLP